MAEINTETEVKLWVDDLAAVEARLTALGAVLHAPRVLERNARYDRPDGSLTGAGIVLRLRQDSRARLTYKEPGTVSDGIVSRMEAEVEVSDFDTTALILERLGFVFSFAYEKYRTTYVLNDAEVTLDEMPFGSFVEIEASAEGIGAAVDALQLRSASRVELSYAAAFNVLRDRLKLPFTDATFGNFKSVELPGNLREILTSD